MKNFLKSVQSTHRTLNPKCKKDASLNLSDAEESDTELDYDRFTSADVFKHRKLPSGAGKTKEALKSTAKSTVGSQQNSENQPSKQSLLQPNEAELANSKSDRVSPQNVGKFSEAITQKINKAINATPSFTPSNSVDNTSVSIEPTSQNQTKKVFIKCHVVGNTDGQKGQTSSETSKTLGQQQTVKLNDCQSTKSESPSSMIVSSNVDSDEEAEVRSSTGDIVLDHDGDFHDGDQWENLDQSETPISGMEQSHDLIASSSTS